MQLEKGERSILSYFPSSTKAEQAFQQLQEAGIPIDEGSMAIDRISRYDMRINNEINSPINNAISLSGPTLYSSSAGEDGPDPLLAASDSASGIGNPDAGAAGGSAFLLTIVTEENNVEEAIKIIKENDGKV